MSFFIKPIILEYQDSKEFIEKYELNKNDLILTNKIIYDLYFKTTKAKAIFYENYGVGEPTDILVEKIYDDIKALNYQRVIAIGGGAIIDVGKLLALENISPVGDLFSGKLEIKKNKELLVIPTTCGTGSEVTSISILAITSLNTKLGLQNNELYPDKAILIPKLLESLPYKVFATSSIDALIHAFESFTSPNASPYSKLFSKEAIRIILKAYKNIAQNKSSLSKYMRDLLIASNYAGIAFSNAGCGLVHAMSYPLGSKYHVPHGESNYVLFTCIYKKYLKTNPNGTIKELCQFLGELLDCKINDCFEKLDSLLDEILPLKKMSEYGVIEDDIQNFINIVRLKQTRLTKNSYVNIDSLDLKEIYKEVY